MNGSSFVTLNIRAPSMHGLQVSGRELRDRGWPDGHIKNCLRTGETSA